MRETDVKDENEIEKDKAVSAYLKGELEIWVNRVEEGEKLLEGSI